MDSEFWLVAAFVLASLPAAFSLVTGFWLTRYRQDPLLPERLFARSVRVTQAAYACVIVLIFLPEGQSRWAIPLTLFLLVLAAYPARKVILEEKWDFVSYLAFQARRWLGVGGFWIILFLTPSLIAGPYRWQVATGLAVILLGWSIWFGRILEWILGAKPFSPPQEFSLVLQRARTLPPQVMIFHDPSDRLPNGLALPSLSRPTVLFTDTLLRVLQPDEQAAACAHEVAHLEEFTRDRLVRREAFSLFMVLMGTVGVAAVPIDYSIWKGAWSVIVALWFWYNLSIARGAEERSDARAVTLSGDPDALVRALVKLHAYARLPRRWPFDLERQATHPSLARRIQTIRKSGGLARTPLSPPRAFFSSAPGRFVVFDPDSLVTGESSQRELSGDVSTLIAGAQKTQRISYAELAELRLAKGIFGGPELSLRTSAGRWWAMPTKPKDTVELQTILDSVDLELTPLPPPRQLRRRVAFTLLAIVAVVVQSLTPRGGGLILLLAAFLVAVFPVNSSSAMLTVAAVGQAVVNFAPLSSRHDLWFAGAFLGIAAITMIVQRAIPPETTFSRGRLVWPVVIMALGTLAIWAWGYVSEIADFGWSLADVVLAIRPEIWIGPAALGAGLLVFRSSATKWAALFLLVFASILVGWALGILPIDDWLLL